MPARQGTTKPACRVRNWEQYNDALVRRGSLILWVDQDTLRAWQRQGPNQQGAQSQVQRHDDLMSPDPAHSLSPHPAGHRGIRSLFGLLGVDRPVPDSTTLCRRAATVRISLPKRTSGPLHLALDSTGLKVDGEGEWEVRQHGYSKRRTWLKLHLAIDPRTPEIPAAVVSEPGLTEVEAVSCLLGQVDNPVAGVGADGA